MFDLLAEISLDTGAERISVHGTRTADGFYEGRIASMSDLVREIRVAGGISPISSGKLVIRDADGEWKRKAAATEFLNRTITVKLANADTGQTSTILTARIWLFSSDAESLMIDFRDDSYDRLLEPVPLRVFPDIFPDMPQTTPTAMIPIVLGTVTSSLWDSQGHIPAYLVDPKISQSKYRYVAAQHPLKSISAVYRYGLLVNPAEYTISYANMSTPDGTVRMTFIDFDTDQRDPGSERDALITYDATGLTEDNLESGALITSIPDALESALSLLPVSPLESTDFDSAFQSSANSDYSTAGLSFANNGLAITERQTRWIDIVDEFAKSFNLQMFVTGAGKFAIRFDDASPAASKLSLFDDQDILQDSWDAESPADSLATINFWYARDHGRRTWAARSSFNDAAAQTSLGRNVQAEIELPGIRNINSGKKICQIKLFQGRPSRQHIRFQTEPRLGMELGDVIQVTHFAGGAADGLGFRSRVCEITGLVTSLSRDGQVFYRIEAIDAPGLTLGSPSDAEASRTSQVIPQRAVEIFSDILFAPSGNATATWGAHDIKLSDGTEYTGVSSGTTGTMSVVTYVYFSPDENSGALLTTTNFKTATGRRKWIMAVCRPGPTAEQPAMIDNRVGFVSVNSATVPRGSTGDSLPDGSIYHRHLRVGSVEADTINVISIASISGVFGTFTSATLDVDGQIDLLSGADLVFTPSDVNPSMLIWSDVALMASSGASGGSGLFENTLYVVPTAHDSKTLQFGRFPDQAISYGGLFWAGITFATDDFWIFTKEGAANDAPTFTFEDDGAFFGLPFKTGIQIGSDVGASAIVLEWINSSSLKVFPKTIDTAMGLSVRPLGTPAGTSKSLLHAARLADGTGGILLDARGDATMRLNIIDQADLDIRIDGVNALRVYRPGGMTTNDETCMEAIVRRSGANATRRVKVAEIGSLPSGALVLYMEAT